MRTVESSWLHGVASLLSGSHIRAVATKGASDSVVRFRQITLRLDSNIGRLFISFPFLMQSASRISPCWMPGHCLASELHRKKSFAHKYQDHNFFSSQCGTRLRLCHMPSNNLNEISHVSSGENLPCFLLMTFVDILPLGDGQTKSRHGTGNRLRGQIDLPGWWNW